MELPGTVSDMVQAMRSILSPMVASALDRNGSLIMAPSIWLFTSASAICGNGTSTMFTRFQSPPVFATQLTPRSQMMLARVLLARRLPSKSLPVARPEPLRTTMALMSGGRSAERTEPARKRKSMPSWMPSRIETMLLKATWKVPAASAGSRAAPPGAGEVSISSPSAAKKPWRVAACSGAISTTGITPTRSLVRDCARTCGAASTVAPASAARRVKIMRSSLSA